MDDKLKQRIKADESKHKLYLFLHLCGGAFFNYGVRGFWPFGDGKVLAAIRIAIHLPLLAICFGFFQDFLYSFIAYVAVLVVLIVVGKILYNVFEKQLDKHQAKCIGEHRQYYLEQCEKHDLQTGPNGAFRQYSNGMVVSGNSVDAILKRDCCYMRIYQLEDPDEVSAFYAIKYDQSDTNYVIEKGIASVEFNKKFGVVTHKANEMECIKFLSPSVQLGLIKSRTIGKFSHIFLNGVAFSAKTSYNIPFPSTIDFYCWKPLMKHYKEVDTYCKKMVEMMDIVHADLTLMGFFQN